MDTPALDPRPPPLPTTPAPAPLAVAALVLGLVAVVSSPLLVGILPGLAGIIVAVAHLRRRRERRGLAWWGGGLSAVAVVVAGAWGCFLTVLVMRLWPGGGGEGLSVAAREELAALDAKAAYTATGSLADQGPAKAKMLSAFCLDREDNLLTCDEEGRCIRVVGPDNLLKASWPLEFWPQAIACRADGSVVVAGTGKVALLGPDGQPLASGELPQATSNAPAFVGQSADARARYERAATSVAATGDDIFVCARAGTGYTVYRLTPGLDEAVPVIKGLRGCCGQMDMTARDGVLYVAANSDFQVVRYDREGRKLGGFGRTGKGPEPCFDGCCEPKNLAFGPDGSLYLAGSGKCAIGHYTAEGGFIEYVGRVDGITGCVRVTVAVNRDASRVYMLDTDHNTVRVLTRREPQAPAAVPEASATPAG
jgi:hypothetical protein